MLTDGREAPLALSHGQPTRELPPVPVAETALNLATSLLFVSIFDQTTFLAHTRGEEPPPPVDMVAAARAISSAVAAGLRAGG